MTSLLYSSLQQGVPGLSLIPACGLCVLVLDLARNMKTVIVTYTFEFMMKLWLKKLEKRRYTGCQVLFLGLKKSFALTVKGSISGIP